MNYTQGGLSVISPTWLCVHTFSLCLEALFAEGCKFPCSVTLGCGIELDPANTMLKGRHKQILKCVCAGLALWSCHHCHKIILWVVNTHWVSVLDWKHRAVLPALLWETSSCPYLIQPVDITVGEDDHFSGILHGSVLYSWEKLVDTRVCLCVHAPISQWHEVHGHSRCLGSAMPDPFCPALLFLSGQTLAGEASCTVPPAMTPLLYVTTSAERSQAWLWLISTSNCPHRLVWVWAEAEANLPSVTLSI